MKEEKATTAKETNMAPQMLRRNAINLPGTVLGYMSPYPIVVMVTTVHHRQLSKRSKRTEFSTIESFLKNKILKFVYLSHDLITILKSGADSRRQLITNSTGFDIK